MKLHVHLIALGLSSALAAQEKLKPYDDVVPSNARTQSGIFKVHRVAEKLLYEIPVSQLNQDFLLVSQVAQSHLVSGDGGGEPVDTRVVRWVRRDRRVLLQSVDYRVWANPKLPVSEAVQSANHPTILASFQVETAGPDDAPVIDVTKVFTQDLIELSPKFLLKARQLDRERSFLDAAKAYPTNIEVQSTLTVVNDSSTNSNARPPGSATVTMRYSMVKLPEQPMMPRLQDRRVGYFSIGQLDYGRDEHYVDTRRYIARWRLEKKNPKEAVSDPIKPIVFYIDPATPKVWVPAIKRGVLQWKKAFEEAGFKNAILCLDAPPSDWSMEDARFSVIRWVASETANAYGPHISDPRTGEILDADIHIFHNILDLQRRWYVTQVGHLDPRAKHLPLPDDLMGDLLEYVVAHEVGHSLGLPHNMRASSTYPLAKLRDRDWVHRMGHTPSIMDYSRFNYVAQPEDQIALPDLIPKVGVYDRFAIHWGYAPIEGARTPDAELPTLDRWARAQDTTPWLRFSNMDSVNEDPGDQLEAVGDADPIGATALGLKSLKRVQAQLVGATSQPGQSYAQLAVFYRQLIGQWATELAHVIPMVGGVVHYTKYAGQNGPLFQVVPRARQLAALNFLLREAFQPQPWLVDPNVTGRLIAAGGWDVLAQVQDGLLLRLIDPRRLNRMAEQTATHPKQSLSPSEFLERLRHSIFQELHKPGAVIPYPRRGLQRSFVQAFRSMRLTKGEAKGLALQQLRKLAAELKQARPALKDADSLAHLDRLADEVARELDTDTSASSASLPHLWTETLDSEQHNCWHNTPTRWVEMDR